MSKRSGNLNPKKAPQVVLRRQTEIPMRCWKHERVNVAPSGVLLKSTDLTNARLVCGNVHCGTAIAPTPPNKIPQELPPEKNWNLRQEK